MTRKITNKIVKSTLILTTLISYSAIANNVNNESPVILYSEKNFNGSSLSLSESNKNLVNLFNDKLTSIKIKEGWQVDLYEHTNYNGHSIILTSNNLFISQFNNRTSSIKVREISKINYEPEIKDIPKLSFIINDSRNFEIQVIATDKNKNDKLEYKLESAPNWISINEHTGLIIGSPTVQDLGDFRFNIIVSDGKAEIKKTIEGKIKNRGSLHTQFLDKKHIKIILDMPDSPIPDATIIYGNLFEIERIENKDYTVNFTDVNIYKEGDNWIIINKTLQPISSLLVKDDSDLMILNLSESIPSYSRAVVNIEGEQSKSLSIVHQKIMFNPNIDLSKHKKTCDDISVLCYNSPKDDSERLIYERTLSYIHNIFNEVNFQQKAVNFLQDNCSKYSDCTNYSKSDPKGIPYGYYQYLRMGHEGHNLSMRVMRNKYAGEGVGGGSAVNLNSITAASGGWASIWEHYINVNNPNGYRILPMKTLFHEIAHAYGFSHSSGMSYGISDRIAAPYITDMNYDPSIIPDSTAPSIVIDAQRKNNNILSLSLSKNDIHSNIKSISLTVSSQDKLSFNINHIENTNEIELEFIKIPQKPIFIQVWSDDGKYISTLKYMLNEPYICAYSDINYTGDELCFTDSQDIIPFNDGAQSIKGFNGARINAFSGLYYTGEQNLTATEINDGQYYSISFSPSVCLFTYGGFGGKKSCYYEDQPRLNINDDASSLKLFNDAKVRLFKDSDYNGGSKEILENTNHLGDFNDIVSSFRFINKIDLKPEILPDSSIDNGFLPDWNLELSTNSSIISQDYIKGSKNRNIFFTIPTPTVSGVKEQITDGQLGESVLTIMAIQNNSPIPVQIKLRAKKITEYGDYPINDNSINSKRSKIEFFLLAEDNKNVKSSSYSVNLTLNIKDKNDDSFNIYQHVNLKLNI